LLFDNTGKGTTLAGGEGAAAVEQSSAAMEMSSNIAAGGKIPNISIIDRTTKTPTKGNFEEEEKDASVNVEEIKVDIEPIGEVEQTPSKEMTDKKMKVESPEKSA